MKNKKKKKSVKAKPVMVKGMSFDAMLAEVRENSKNARPLTKKEQIEVDKALKELIKSQGRGDVLMMFNI